MGQKRPKGIFEICSEEGKQQITFNSIKEFDDLISALERAKALYVEEHGEQGPDETLYVEKSDGTACGFYSKGYMSSRGSDPEAGKNDLYSFCLLNADGIVMAKILAGGFFCGGGGVPHTFYENDKIVAVAPASWTIVREENFDEES